MKKVSSKLIRTRIDALRKLMHNEGISVYMISDQDYHLSDFQSEYFKTLEFMSGFTGMSGMMIITLENAHLWTDARYINQAQSELDGTGIILHIDTDDNDPIRTIQAFFEASAGAIVENMFEEGFSYIQQPEKRDKYIIAFDGRTVRFSLMDEIISSLSFAYESGIIQIDARQDLVADIWDDRPEMPCERIYVLPDDISGRAAGDKLAELRTELAMYGDRAAAVITSVEEVAWLFNIRGNDIPYSTTAYAYGYISHDDAFIFIDEVKVTGRVREQLRAEGIEVKQYDEFYGFLERVPDEVFFIDPDSSNFAVVITIDSRNTKVIISRDDLIDERKAIKNAREVQNASFFGITDGVAMTEFMYWIQSNVSKNRITEMDAVNKISELRQKAGALKPSFPTIVAYGPNSGTMSYYPSNDNETVIEPKGMLLVDAGAHYRGATTDVSRTIPVGPLTHQEKYTYTLLLASVLEYSSAIFPVGLTDMQLDIIARQPLWKRGVEVTHATGHGVGAMLSVEEGPLSIDWGKSGTPAPIRPGMIMTCEPGIYYPDEFGVRHENMYLSVERGSDFQMFADLTYVPIDTAAILPEVLTDDQIAILNSYHEKLRIILMPELSDEELKKWFLEVTEPIHK